MVVAESVCFFHRTQFSETLGRDGPARELYGIAVGYAHVADTVSAIGIYLATRRSRRRDKVPASCRVVN